MADDVRGKTGGGDFELHPDDQHAMLCVDVINLGEKVVEWQGVQKIQEKLAFVFASGAKDRQGHLLTVQQEFTNSMSPKSKLVPFLNSWRGKALTEAEMQDYPLGKMEGQTCLVTVEHTLGKNGRTYANIASISKLPKGMIAAVTLKDYTRGEWWAKKKEAYAAAVRALKAEWGVDDESIVRDAGWANGEPPNWDAPLPEEPPVDDELPY